MNLVSTCPKCGAPIYMSTVGSGTQLPMAQHTCLCRLQSASSEEQFFEKAKTVSKQIDNGTYSKELSDEEIHEIRFQHGWGEVGKQHLLEFARAILKRASEK